MANFCSSCGSPMGGGAFCPGCGANVQQPQPAAQLASQPATATAAKMSPLAKLAIALVVFLFVGAALAAGGLYYIGHRISRKVHEVKESLLNTTGSSTTGSSATGSNTSDSSTTEPGSSADSSAATSAHIDYCSLLSTDEVSQAIGVPIVGTQPIGSGCSYLAAGTQADMASRHMSAMAALKGADANQQQMLQTIASGFLKSYQAEHPHDSSVESNGRVPVLAISVDTNAADFQMKLNENVLGNLGPKEASIEGIGDQAFDTAGSMLMFRKGDKLVRILYTSCPCNVEAIKPLARTLAGRM